MIDEDGPSQGALQGRPATVAEELIVAFGTQYSDVLERIAKACEKTAAFQGDILNELRDVNENLRWQTEFFKTQTQEVQTALSQRGQERDEWLAQPDVQQEIESQVQARIARVLESLETDSRVNPTKAIANLRQYAADRERPAPKRRRGPGGNGSSIEELHDPA